MKADIPIRVTVVDLLGIAVPGTLILALLTIAFKVVVTGFAASPQDIVRSLVFPTESGAIAAAIAAAVMLGYASSGVAVHATDMVSHLLTLVLHYRSCDKFHGWRDHLFPYQATHRDTAVYAELTKRIKEWIGVEAERLPRYGVFAISKRKVLMVAPELAQGIEQAEAMSRMIASLFLCSCIAVLIGIVSLIKGLDTGWWLYCALAMFIMLAVGFRIKRHREVHYVYMTALLATGPKVERVNIESVVNG